MKKIYLCFIIFSVISCSSDEQEKDCDCDRVVEPISHFQLPDGSTFGGYSTINDCSGVQHNYSYNGTPPHGGDCK